MNYEKFRQRINEIDALLEEVGIPWKDVEVIGYVSDIIASSSNSSSGDRHTISIIRDLAKGYP